MRVCKATEKSKHGLGTEILLWPYALRYPEPLCHGTPIGATTHRPLSVKT